jgi:alanyl-tRNA synthetase
VSVQEENVKLKKQVEQLIRDKAKGLKELTQQIQEINGVQFLAVQVDLNGKELKIWLMIWEIRN